MDTNEEIILYKDLSYRIIGLAMRVHSVLGHGFLEKVHEKALMVLLRRENIEAAQQAPITVSFEGEVVGNYYADILVENKIIPSLFESNRYTVSAYSELWESKTGIRKNGKIKFVTIRLIRGL
jgi:GxxExxY protein